MAKSRPKPRPSPSLAPRFACRPERRRVAAARRPATRARSDNPTQGGEPDDRPPGDEGQQQRDDGRKASPFRDRRRNCRCRAARAPLPVSCPSPASRRADAARSIRCRRRSSRCTDQQIRAAGRRSADSRRRRRRSPAPARRAAPSLAVSLSPGTCKAAHRRAVQSAGPAPDRHRTSRIPTARPAAARRADRCSRRAGNGRGTRPRGCGAAASGSLPSLLR